MFEDSDQPFDPEDNVPKPNVGDIIVLKEINDLILRSKRNRVTHVFDSLAEDWGADGETAWAMHDTNDEAGKKGHWYALIEDTADDFFNSCVPSYEVAEVIPG